MESSDTGILVVTVGLNFWKSVEPEKLFRAIADDKNRKSVIHVMKTLTHDPVWTDKIVEMVEQGQIETRCFTSWLAGELQPTRYLEVGVRRGFSMAMVASQAPQAEIYGFDLWSPGYAGGGNPGPKFIQSEMERLGYRKQVHFISGNSHKTLPAFFGSKRTGIWDRLRLSQRVANRQTYFELVTIDGDHSLMGAYQDLLDAMPHIAVGGVIVFDDIAPDYSKLCPKVVKAERGKDPHGWGDLFGVWRAVQERFSNFRFFEYTRNPPGVGIGVRLE